VKGFGISLPRACYPKPTDGGGRWNGDVSRNTGTHLALREVEKILHDELERARLLYDAEEKNLP
jgi:hypothetical protein